MGHQVRLDYLLLFPVRVITQFLLVPVVQFGVIAASPLAVIATVCPQSSFRPPFERLLTLL